MKKILVSDKEEELIAAIRNYKSLFPGATRSYYGMLNNFSMR